jgi:hypothetical protein
MARIASLSEVPPHIQPPIAQAPKPITDASIPEFPNGRIFIASPQLSAHKNRFACWQV